jgi:DNA sulfur modification protein DndD
MRILSLELRNFMPFKGVQSMNFPSDDFQNVALIYGDNMRGKTSLLNAMRWALYGEAKDRYGKRIALHKLINVDAVDEGDGDMEVSLSFEHDGKRYDISRVARRRAGVSRPQKPEDMRVEPLMRVDREPIRADLVVHQINQFIPEQVSRFFLFDGELLQEYENLLVDEHKQGERIKEAIEQVLGVPALMNARVDLKQLRKPLDKAFLREASLKGNAGLFLEQLAVLQEEGERKEDSQKALLEEIASQQDDIRALGEIIDASEAKFVQKQEADGKRKRLADIKSELKVLEDRRLKSVGEVWRDMLQPGLAKALTEAQHDVRRLLDEFTSGVAVSSTFIQMSIQSAECGLCQQALDHTKKELLKSKCELTKELEAARSGSALAGAVLRAERLSALRFPGVRLVLQEIQATEHRLEIDATKLQGEIETLEQELAGFDSETIAKARRKRDAALQNLRQIEVRADDIAKEIETISKEKEKLRLLINESEENKNQRSSKVVSMLDALENAFAASVENLRDDLRLDIQKRATDAFKELTTDSTYKELRINKNYGLTIVDSSDRDVTLRSAGAEQIVALSLIEALNGAARSRGPVIMDTPFGRLDPKHRVKVLRYLPETSTQVVLFVHEGEVTKENEAAIAPRIGAVYHLERVSSSQTKLVRATQ